MNVLQTIDLKKQYGSEPNITRALDGVNLSVEQGEFVAVVGTSGSGKSTLLNILGLLEDWSDGTVELFGQPLPSLNSKRAIMLRRNTINYLFQSFALISNKTVKENLYLATYFKK